VNRKTKRSSDSSQQASAVRTEKKQRTDPSQGKAVYWVQSDAGSPPFRVRVSSSDQDIDSLKKAIKAEKPNACARVDADQITVLVRGTKEAVSDPEQSLESNTGKTPYLFKLPEPQNLMGISLNSAGGTLSTAAVEDKFAKNKIMAKFTAVSTPIPLGGKTWDRSTTEEEFDKCVSFLHKHPSKKGMGTAEGRNHYPLTAVLGRPGAGKTFLLQLLADKKAKTHVAILISLGNGTKVEFPEIARGAHAAIAVRILYTLFRSIDWGEFLGFCNGFTIPSIKEAIDMVRAVAKRPNEPCLLLVDETAAAMTIAKDAELFSAAVLTAIGEVQEHAVAAIANRTKNAAPGIYVVASSLQEDVVKLAMTRSGRSITYLNCDPFSDATLCALRDKWCTAYRRTHYNLSRQDAERYVESLLTYSGGVPRVVQWASEQLFTTDKQGVELSKYYITPPWEGVHLGQRLAAEHLSFDLVGPGLRSEALLEACDEKRSSRLATYAIQSGALASKASTRTMSHRLYFFMKAITRFA
jgi:hypothetical protein